MAHECTDPARVQRTKSREPARSWRTCAHTRAPQARRARPGRAAEFRKGPVAAV